MKSLKMVGIAKIVEPAAVSARCALEGGTMHDGAIYCEIPELGMMNPDLIYCRYGLALPFLKIQMGWKVLVEPTVDNGNRFFYTGIADCGGSIHPAATDQMILQFAAQGIFASTAGVLSLSNKNASEPFVNGNQLKTWTDKVDAAIKKLLDWSMTGVAPGPTGGITPLTVAPTEYPTLPAGALSTKIKGE